jgi:hypothetical protein
MAAHVARRIAALLGAPTGSIEVHAATYEALAQLALDGSVDPDDRVFCAQLAADYAWFSHPGRFCDDRVEQSVGDLVRAAPPARVARREGRVLHVLTEGFTTGGHTRLARRWIEADAGRVHSVALTRQSLARVPAGLAEAVGRRGGTVFDLASRAWSIRDRAEVLRRLAADHEFVVLHTHPHDVVPVLALANWADRPRVLFVNHADHVFWLGASVTDALVCLRASGALLATTRRGISADRIAIVPIPITAPSAEQEPRASIRSRLRLAPEDVAIVSIAGSYKFRPMGDLDYPATVATIIAADPRAQVRVIGPIGSAGWEEALRHSGERLVVSGPSPAVGDVLRAADIYLDSFPLGSLTSMLEAGRAGLPLVGLNAHPAEADVLASNGPGLERTSLRTSTMPETVQAVLGLIEDGVGRRALGAETARAIAATNDGPAWRDALERAYATARQAGEPSAAPVIHDRTPLDALLVSAHDGLHGLARALAGQIPLAPVRTRLEIAAAVVRSEPRISARAAIPITLRRRLRSTR